MVRSRPLENEKMLWLPKGINVHLSSLSLDKEETLGKLLIEIACKHAWETGFVCDHKHKKFNQADTKRYKTRNPVSGQNHTIFKCQVCGMLFKRGALMRSGQDSLVSLGYPTVGFVEKEQTHTESMATVLP